MPYFSIIIPNYNGSLFLKECLDSIQGQTFKDFEAIIIDDGSTDDSRSIVSHYVEADSRFKLMAISNTGLPSKVRNEGIRAAKGEWISFLDSDDYWTLDKLQKVHDFISNSKDSALVGIGHNEYQFEEGGQNEKSDFRNLSGPNFYEDLILNGNCFSTSCMTVKKTVLLEVGSFSEDDRFYIVEDYDLWMKLSNIGSLYNMPDVLTHYRISDFSISKKIDRLHNNLLELTNFHIQKSKIPNKEKVIQKNIARIEGYRARTYQKNKDFKKALAACRVSISHNPFSVKVWVILLFSLVRISI